MLMSCANILWPAADLQKNSIVSLGHEIQLSYYCEKTHYLRYELLVREVLQDMKKKSWRGKKTFLVVVVFLKGFIALWKIVSRLFENVSQQVDDIFCTKNRQSRRKARQFIIPCNEELRAKLLRSGLPPPSFINTCINAGQRLTTWLARMLAFASGFVFSLVAELKRHSRRIFFNTLCRKIWFAKFFLCCSSTVYMFLLKL